MLKLVLPLGQSGDVRNSAFSVLCEGEPLKIIEVSNLIRRRYGIFASFQAVRKALLALESEGVLRKEGARFFVSKEWVLESKEYLDSLYLRLCAEKKGAKFDIDRGEAGVLVFSSINEMAKAWEGLSDVWFKKFRKGDYNVNCYQAAHSWEVLLHPDVEAKLMGQSRAKGIKSYILCTTNTPLDRSLVKFHESIGVRMAISPSGSKFDKSYYVGTYGDLIIESRYPPEIVKKLDDYFKRHTSVESLDLSGLSAIANSKVEVRMTVIRSLEMAKRINASIVSAMRR